MSATVLILQLDGIENFFELIKVFLEAIEENISEYMFIPSFAVPENPEDDVFDVSISKFQISDLSDLKFFEGTTRGVFSF
ncbi:MAG: hypothetical protein ACFFD4_15970 [Candidatus Odinarchaeota archaeon]